MIIIFMGLGVHIASCAKTDEQAISTQGVSNFNPQAIENSKLTKKETKDQKDKLNQSKYQIKLHKKIRRNANTRAEKVKELKYLEHRLELKKQKLELLNPGEKKGES